MNNSRPFGILVKHYVGVPNQSYSTEKPVTSATFDLNFFMLFTKKPRNCYIFTTLWSIELILYQIAQNTYIFIRSNTTICMKPNAYCDFS